MSDEMLNKSKKIKSSGLQGIGDSVKMMDEYDMNALNDSIGPEEHGTTSTKKFNKNS